jgi:hypothetical protein
MQTLKRLNSADMDYDETDEEKSFNAILRKLKSSNGIYSKFLLSYFTLNLLLFSVHDYLNAPLPIEHLTD